MNKKSLGKGLGELLPGYQDDPFSDELKRKIIDINLNEIKKNPQQPRQEFDPDALEELSKSISEKGVLQPVLVREDDDDYILIAGERRYEASKLAGLRDIPAIVIKADTDEELLELAIIENVQREDLNPIEEGRAYLKLSKDFDLSHEEVAKKVGKSRASVTNLIRLLNLSEPVQDMILNGSVSVGHAKVLLSVEDPAEREDLAHLCENNALSVRELEKKVKSLKKSPPDRHKPEPTPPSPFLDDVKSQLVHHFGTQVNINDKEQKGKISIEYYSLEDFNRIIDLLLGRGPHEE